MEDPALAMLQWLVMSDESAMGVGGVERLREGC